MLANRCCRPRSTALEGCSTQFGKHFPLEAVIVPYRQELVTDHFVDHRLDHRPTEGPATSRCQRSSRSRHQHLIVWCWTWYLEHVHSAMSTPPRDPTDALSQRIDRRKFREKQIHRKIQAHLDDLGCNQECLVLCSLPTKTLSDPPLLAVTILSEKPSVDQSALVATLLG